MIEFIPVRSLLTFVKMQQVVEFPGPFKDGSNAAQNNCKKGRRKTNSTLPHVPPQFLFILAAVFCEAESRVLLNFFVGK